MNKKIIGIFTVYTLIMAGLWILTYGMNWTPSGYDYAVEGETLTIEHGAQTETVDISGQYAEAVLFFGELSEEREQWQMDVIVIAVLLPLLLLIAVPERRPFRKKVPAKYYGLAVVAITVLYAAFSVTMHLEYISGIENYAEQLTE